MPEPLSREEFEAAYGTVAPRVAQTAPPGLSREQFNDLVFEEIERSRRGPRRDASLLDRAIPTAMRIVPTVAGGFVGTLAGPAGTVAGGAAGGALGEYAAERYEQLTGQRDDVNPYQVATQTALGAIPMGKVAGSTIGQIVTRRAAQGAGMGALATGATAYAETGELPSAGTVARGGLLGGLLGGVVGNVEGRGLRRLGRLDVPETPTPQPAGYLPPGPRYTVTPDGRIAPAGTDIPMAAGPDGSFVRGVPAEYARREIVGLLPAGPRFAADAAGQVAPIEQAEELSRIARASQPGESGGRLVSAAALERQIDPTQETGRAVRVRQYSGDPGAVEAPLVNDEQRRILSVMRQDLDEFPSQRGRLVRDPQDETSSVYAHGGPGSPVGDDIRVISGTRAGNALIARAIDDLLEGKPATNKLHVAALDAAQGYVEGRPGYRGPVLPLNEPNAGRGGEAVDDFERFAAMLDEAEPGAPQTFREPGEEGFIRNQLVMRGGGALAGGVAGAATGDDPQERLENALLFGAAGAAAPSLLRTRGSQAGSRARVLSVDDLNRAATASTRASARVHGAALRDPLAGMDRFLEKFAGSNPLLRDGIKERLVEHGGFAAQRRGSLPVETMADVAQQVRVDLARSLPKGTALNAEGIVAFTRGVKSTMGRVQEVSARIASGQGTDADVVALAAAQADADVVLKSLMGARSEAGRALAMFRTFSAVLDTGDVTLYRRAAGPLRDEAAEFAARVSQIRDPLEQYRFLQAQRRPALTDKIRSYVYSSMLSGVKTHERNAIGSAVSVLSRFVSTPIAAGLDAVQAAATGRAREVFVGELHPAAVGAVAGFQKGLTDFAFTLKHGVSPDALRRSVTAAVEAGQLDVPRVEFGGGGGNPFNWPGRMLDAADTLFRSTARNMELYASAYAQARKQGLRGERLIQRAAELRTDDALTLAAQKFAVESVFQQKPGKVTGALQAAVKAIPGAYFVVPFLKTPSNILKTGMQASPVGFVTQAGRQGGRAGVQAQGMAAMGTILLAPLAWLAATNRLSGSGPRDPAARAALMESGWRPNSVRVGDQWVEYSLFQPVSVPAAVVANAYEAWREGGADEQDAGNIATQVVARSLRSVLEQSYLSGLYDFMSAVENPERFASQWAGRTAHTLTPFAGFQRTITQATDPTIRQPKTAGEVFRSNVPGLSTSVQPRLTRFGEVAQRPGGGRAAFDALNVSPVVNDPIAAELSRLGVALAVPSDRITLPGGASLTADQSRELREGKGRRVREVLSRMMANPNYQRLPDELKRRALERVKRAASGEANTSMRRRVLLEQRRQERQNVTEGMSFNVR